MPMFRFGFILTTSIGNLTRYSILRKYAERDTECDCTWAPVKHFFAPDEHDPVSWVPSPFYKRAVVLNQAWPVLGRLKQFDAVMIHQLETLSFAAVRSLLKPHPPIFAAQDNPPIIDPDNYPLYQEDKDKSPWRRSMRLAIDLWTARHTPYFIPMSHWQADVLTRGCGIAAERVTPIHVGMDLEKWPRLEDRPRTPGPVRLLFVGGDFERKGGPQLLDLFAKTLSSRMTLDLVTKNPPANLPPNVIIHDNINSAEDSRRLYADADILVLPTTADMSSWVGLEAAASNCPTVAYGVGGVPDIVRDGKNGRVVRPGDIAAFHNAIEELAANPDKRKAMGLEGRQIVETDFDASKNVSRMLDVMKQVVVSKRKANRSNS